MVIRHLYDNCLFFFLALSYVAQVQAQTKQTYWQQEVSYKMDIQMDVQTSQFKGKQTIRYKNNSPDKLDKVFFHLYLNAFQPGSDMDVRSRTLADPDPRIGSKISRLEENEIGYQRISKLTQDGVALDFEVVGTILEVTLKKPIPPGRATNLEMEYVAQVPVQTRRNGRDNIEGISYSMAQWYPKLCEYDKHGWQAHPYIGREFYGVWGDFDVNITIDADYVVAATGELQNGKRIGHGYVDNPKLKSGKVLTWHFVAENVHDFVWAADPDYIHDVHRCSNGVVMHSFYQAYDPFTENWEKLLPIMEEAFNYINQHFGQYPYPVYSFIQGGDGGMEYPMATLITGHRSLTSLVGVSVHEAMHSWFQMILGFNESYYYWMDEGFTNYASERVMEHLKAKGLIPGEPDPWPFESFYKGYTNLVNSEQEQPLSTHADHFDYSSTYSIAAYAKGAVFIHQLEYVLGKDAFDHGMLAFFDAWKFKHPDDNDFIRIMEKSSGLELDWYKDYMVYSIKTIDYAIDTVYAASTGSTIRLRRDGGMPMPVDMAIELMDGSTKYYSIPLDIMRGAKIESSLTGEVFQVLADWHWVNPYYHVDIPFNPDQIQSITIDPSLRMADQVGVNNHWPISNP